MADMQVFCRMTACVHNKPEYHNETVCTCSFVSMNNHGKCQTMQLAPPKNLPGQLSIEGEGEGKTYLEKALERGDEIGYAHFD